MEPSCQNHVEEVPCQQGRDRSMTASSFGRERAITADLPVIRFMGLGLGIQDLGLRF